MGSEDLADSERIRAKDATAGSGSRTAHEGGAGPASGRFWLTNRGLGIGLLVLVLCLGATIWFSDWAHERVRDGFTLGGFPLLSVALMVLTLLVMIFDGQAHKTTSELRHFQPIALVVVLAATALIGICFLAILWIGFVPAIALLVLAGALGLGFRPAWLALVVAVATAIGLRLLLFALGMNVADGLLQWLFGGS